MCFIETSYRPAEKPKSGKVSGIYVGCVSIQSATVELSHCNSHSDTYEAECCGGYGKEACPVGGYLSRQTEPEESDYTVLIIVAVIVAASLIGYLFILQRRRLSNSEEPNSAAEGQHLVPRTPTTPESGPGTTTTAINEMTSGRGPQNTVERTIALEVKLVKVIGRGRFGQVSLGIWNGQNVACKIFDSRDHSRFSQSSRPDSYLIFSWKRETKAYKIGGIAHKYVLNLIAADMRVRDNFSAQF